MFVDLFSDAKKDHCVITFRRKQLSCWTRGRLRYPFLTFQDIKRATKLCRLIKTGFFFLPGFFISTFRSWFFLAALPCNNHFFFEFIFVSLSIFNLAIKAATCGLHEIGRDFQIDLKCQTDHDFCGERNCDRENGLSRFFVAIESYGHARVFGRFPCLGDVLGERQPIPNPRNLHVAGQSREKD